MAEIWQIAQWLRDGGEEEAAAILEQCEIQELYVDTAFALAGNGEIDVYDIAVSAPRRLLNGAISAELTKAIEHAVIECFQAERTAVSQVFWQARLPSERQAPSSNAIHNVLAKLNADHVHQEWVKAQGRVARDPEGAITAARTILESVCKSILDEMGVGYDESADLPKLYGTTAQNLSLAPSQHTEEIFKQILGGCFSVVNGLAGLRNRLSDAHGRSKHTAKPGRRHAELAVNLAGSVATFLVGTWAARKRPPA